MKAVDYLKEKARMTNNCGVSCGNCPLKDCTDIERNHPEKAVGIVSKWAKEHPPKTYLSVLLEKIRNVKLNEDGVPDKFCPNEIYGDKGWDGCFQVGGRGNCVECWNREYKEEE